VLKSKTPNISRALPFSLYMYNKYQLGSKYILAGLESYRDNILFYYLYKYRCNIGDIFMFVLIIPKKKKKCLCPFLFFPSSLKLFHK